MITKTLFDDKNYDTNAMIKIWCDDYVTKQWDNKQSPISWSNEVKWPWLDNYYTSFKAV